MAEKLLEASEDKVNRNIKDSVFCDLFGKPEYLIQLYRALHPEDTETEQKDLTIVTLSRIITKTMYNDLGFIVGNRLMVLVEAQSTWTENIVVRFLMYLGETYRRYIEKNDLDIYSSKNIVIPKPELYIIYVGDRKGKPEKISLKQSFFGTEDSCVEVEAKVIYDSKQGDILNQFITFSRVFTEQLKRYPEDRRKAVEETIRICKEKDVLKAYLEQEEAAVVMFTLADQERAWKYALQEERNAGKEIGEAIGEARGEERGEIKGAVKTYYRMKVFPADIVKHIIEDFSLEKDIAEEYVKETLQIQSLSVN